MLILLHPPSQEQENRDLLERFEMACLKTQEQEQELAEVKGLNGSTRLELLSMEAERRRLQEAVSRQEREIQQVRASLQEVFSKWDPLCNHCSFPKHMQAQQAYESRVSSMVRGMSRLEEKLHNAQEENTALLSDQASMRELWVKLDSDKEHKARQLTLKNMDLERVSQRVTAATRLRQQQFVFPASYCKCAPVDDRGAGGRALRGGPDEETAGQREADRPQAGDDTVVHQGEGDQ